MRIKRGDLLPVLTATLTDTPAGGVAAPINLTTATGIRVIGRRAGVATNLFDRTVTGTAAGVVTMPWQAADTAIAGRLWVEIEVTWPGSKPQTFPARGQLAVDVYDDFG